MVAGAIVGFIGDVFDEIFGDGLEDPKVCGPANAFFASNYLTCAGGAAGNFNAEKISGDLNSACMNNFQKCYDGRTARLFCTPMGGAFNDQVSKINAALADGANTITAAAVGGYLSQRKAQLCRFGFSGRIDDAIDDFLAYECTDTLSKAVPLPVNACKFNPPSMTKSRGHGAACGKAAAVTGSARDEMNRTCAAHCRDNPKDCEPPPVCTDPMTGRIYQNAGPFAEQMTCPSMMVTQVLTPEIWKNITGPKLVTQFTFNEPTRRPGSLSGDAGNFVIDGSGPHVKWNDAMPRDRFVTGKCKLRATSANLVMYVDQAPRTGAGRLSLKTMQLVSMSGFDDCGPMLAKLPSGSGSGGASLAYPSKIDDDYVRRKRIPRLGK